jgi:hypothetical protein
MELEKIEPRLAARRIPEERRAMTEVAAMRKTTVPKRVYKPVAPIAEIEPKQRYRRNKPPKKNK